MQQPSVHVTRAQPAHFGVDLWWAAGASLSFSASWANNWDVWAESRWSWACYNLWFFTGARGLSTGGNSEPAWSDGIGSLRPCLSETPTKCSQQVWTILVSKNLFQQINIVLQGRYYFLLYFLKSRARLLKVAHQTLLNNLSLRLGSRVIKFLPLNVNFSSWQILLTSYFYSYFSYPNWHLIMLISKYFLNICLPSLLSLW